MEVFSPPETPAFDRVEIAAEQALDDLLAYCTEEGYQGWDPYDGLNSKLFQSTPLKNWDVARLILIQLCKRSPVNLRPLLLVPKQYNAKGVALILSSFCSLYRICQAKGNLEEFSRIRGSISALTDLLISLRSTDYSGAAWGYNFGWQSRRLFYFPSHTPTVVATSFAVDALVSANEILESPEVKRVILSAADFVLEDLHRTELNQGFLFSYSPLAGNNTVFNASLLGAKVLLECYALSGRSELLSVAKETVEAVCAEQGPSGEWVYGLLPTQQWVDSFHTGYNLVALARYREVANDHQFDEIISRGYSFYLNAFFKRDGTPKYYAEKTYPIDIHCPGQLWVTNRALGLDEHTRVLSDSVLQWTLANMRDKKGYFYYQVKPWFSSKISYMRWSNAFMANALAAFLEQRVLMSESGVGNDN